MTIVRWEPLRGLLNLQERMNRLFDESARGVGRGQEEDWVMGAWAPAVDIFEKGSDVVLKAELPGVDPKDVDIRIESWLEVLPYCGFVPLTVRIENGSTQPHTWTITTSNAFADGGGLSTIAEITVEAGRAGERTVYAPVTAETSRGYYYGSLSLNIRGYGVVNPAAGTVNAPSSYSSNRTACSRGSNTSAADSALRAVATSPARRASRPRYSRARPAAGSR